MTRKETIMSSISDLCPFCMEKLDESGVCSSCGKEASSAFDPAYLKPGTKIMRRYIVGAPMNADTTGVTYICFDTAAGRKVLLREFFPTDLAVRGEKGAVSVNDEKKALFDEEKAKFTELAEKLRSHPEISAIPKISEIFEGNGTAYCFCDAKDEISLREFMLRNGGKLDWSKARAMFLPLVTSVSAIHSAGIVHLGISPETVMVGKDGKIRLLGFRIADARINGSPITAKLFPGFAAVEQYGSIGKPGEHTDVYALAAVLYRVLVGNPPTESINRVTGDELAFPQKVVQNVPPKAIEALAEALQIMPEERTATADAFRTELAAVPSDANKGKKQKNKNKSYMLLAGIMTALVLAAAVAVLYVTVFRKGGETASSDPYISSMQSTVSSDTSSFHGITKVKTFVGTDYAEAIKDIENSDYVFVIDSKQYDPDYPKGKIVSQSPVAGELVDPDEQGKIEVHLSISLGAYTLKMPDLSGRSLDMAYIELFKNGFNYSYISVVEQYEPGKASRCVIGTDIAAGTEVNPDTPVTIYFNTYNADEDTSSNTSSES